MYDEIAEIWRHNKGGQQFIVAELVGLRQQVRPEIAEPPHRAVIAQNADEDVVPVHVVRLERRRALPFHDTDVEICSKSDRVSPDRLQRRCGAAGARAVLDL